MCASDGVIQMTTAVLEFPPKDDFKIFVRVEFQKGINREL
jgi:hypothetical protein